MEGYVPTELLYTVLGICASLVALLGYLLRREKQNNKTANPGDIHMLATGCQSRVDGIGDTLGRIEAAQGEATKVLVEIRTVLRERQ